MNTNITSLLDTASAELNYLEKKTNADLDDKTKNAGSANYTKYARDCFPELQGLAWCCMFVWWCFEKTFGKIMARNLVGEKTAKCSVMKDRMVANKCEVVTKPQPGDIVFFNTSSGIGHIGIVYTTSTSSFSTIEGNTSKGTNDVVPNGGGVFIRAYNYNNSRINSFVRPIWNIIKDDKAVNNTIKYNAEIKATNVNIRAGAGTQYKWLGMETKGFKFEKIGESKDNNGMIWYNFIYRGQSAYIRSDFVKLI